MKILIFSDSHGRSVSMFYAIEQDKPDAIIHLGDYTEDAEELMRAYPCLSVYSVRGNNDYASDAPLQMTITADNVPLYLTHGHRERVSMLSSGHVPVLAREERCAFAFFGHTHRMMLENQNGVWVCNPGSISLPRGGPASYARLTLGVNVAQLLELVDDDGKLLRAQHITKKPL